MKNLSNDFDLFYFLKNILSNPLQTKEAIKYIIIMIIGVFGFDTGENLEIIEALTVILFVVVQKGLLDLLHYYWKYKS
jgi:hypothetical protein